MAKGLFTQGIMVLLRQSVTIQEVADCLSDFYPSEPMPASEDWTFLGPFVLMDMEEDGTGKVVVDIVEHPWPDKMGDPESPADVVAGWELGSFGPHTDTDSLDRAKEQAWVWEEGRSLGDEAVAFLRVRSSYVLGEDDDDMPVIPDGYDPFDELALVTEIAAALTELPQAICYFNPNGEVLRDIKTLNESFEYAEENDFPPLDLWSNVRLFKLENDWATMDTVGNSQLNLLDVEACFHTGAYDFAEIEHFLRLVTCYLEESEEPIETGDTMEGPGEVLWKVFQCDNSLVSPPRPVLRCMPQDGREVPPECLIEGIEGMNDHVAGEPADA